jgi:hypothetical protein
MQIYPTATEHERLHQPMILQNRSPALIAADAAIELAHLGLMTAISGSLANALATMGPRPSLLAQLSAYLPDNARRLDALARELCHLSPEAEFGKAMRALHTQLVLTLKITTIVAEMHEVELRALDPTIDAWRRLAGNCYIVLLLLDACLERHGTPNSRVQNKCLLNLVRAVSAGHHPCIMPDAVVTIPHHAERRIATRQPAGQRIVLVRPQGTLAVELVNVSAQGAMIAVPSTCEVDGDVALIGANGRRHAAVVIWHNENNAGLKFYQPVDPAEFVRI